jgi:hypothetical protein
MGICPGKTSYLFYDKLSLSRKMPIVNHTAASARSITDQLILWLDCYRPVVGHAVIGRLTRACQAMS